MESLLTSSIPTVTLKENLDFPPNILYESRYCNQGNFSVLVCGETYEIYEVVNNVYKLKSR